MTDSNLNECCLELLLLCFVLDLLDFEGSCKFTSVPSYIYSTFITGLALRFFQLQFHDFRGIEVPELDSLEIFSGFSTIFHNFILSRDKRQK